MSRFRSTPPCSRIPCPHTIPINAFCNHQYSIRRLFKPRVRFVGFLGFRDVLGYIRLFLELGRSFLALGPSPMVRYKAIDSDYYAFCNQQYSIERIEGIHYQNQRICFRNIAIEWKPDPLDRRRRPPPKSPARVRGLMATYY